MAKILVVEDEADIRELIKVQLEIAGNQVVVIEDGEEAARYLETAKPFDLYVIDWMLPGLSGVDLCRQIRSKKETKTSPILMVTALTQSEKIIEGLDAGADDYVTKPFDMNVLLARVRAQLRKNNTQKNVLNYGPLKMNFKNCDIHLEGQRVPLTNTEYQILKMMAVEPGHVFTREQIIGNIQGDNIVVTHRTVDTHVAGLRKKLATASKYIETIRGIGYRFSDETGVQ
jgi:DNA-binding response OmpR family regulator